MPQRSHRVIAVIVLATLALASIAALERPHTTTTSIEPERIARVFARHDNPDTPGCAAGVIVDGEPAFSEYYGAANLDYGIPLGPESRLMVGSLAKQFTAAAVILLAQRDRIALNEDVRSYLPEFPDLAARSGYNRPITVENLLHHTSGIRDLIHLLHIEGRGLDPETDTERITQMLHRQRSLNFEPGARYNYSNTGYIILAALVKRVTGMSLREFSERELFEPSGMHSTHVHDDPTLVVPNRSMSYLPLSLLGDTHRRSGVERFGEFYRNHVSWIGARGVFTTLDDLARWERNYYDNRTPIRNFAEEMTRVGRSNAGGRISYAGGLFVGSYKGLATVGHDGNYMGFRSHYQRFPDHNTAIAVLCNSAGIDPTRKMRRVADIVFEGRFERELAEFAGVYRDPDYQTRYEVSVQHGRLRMRGPRSVSTELEWRGGARFSWEDRRVRFERDAGGEYNRMTVTTNAAGTRTLEREPSSPNRPAEQ